MLLGLRPQAITCMHVLGPGPESASAGVTGLDLRPRRMICALTIPPQFHIWANARGPSCIYCINGLRPRPQPQVYSLRPRASGLGHLRARPASVSGLGHLCACMFSVSGRSRPLQA
eukprot:362520-Chlamydomonas_euryale.AAC.5